MSADKPAATGSGEPFPVCAECGKKVTVSWESHADECTPPASQLAVTLSRYDPHPPVVLTRTQYSNLIGDLLLAKDRIRKSQKNLALETVDRMLALLRAAEQK